MRTDLLPYLFSFIWPAAILLLVFCFVARPRRHPGIWLVVGAALAVGIVVFPVGGLPLGRWFTGLCANFSLPLLALIAAVIARRVFRVELLGKGGTRDAMWFGAVAGVMLYPMALGLGPVDPYALGWSFGWLFAATGTLTAICLWRGNRFGAVLLSAIAAYHLHLLESDNYWDYLVDPVYFLISLALAVRAGLRLMMRPSLADEARRL